MLLLAVCLQLLLAFVACIGEGLMREPAHIAARCVLAAVASSCLSPHALLLAVCLQLLLAFVACIGAGLMCEPAHVAARCVLAAVACLCGLHWCRAHV